MHMSDHSWAQVRPIRILVDPSKTQQSTGETQLDQEDLNQLKWTQVAQVRLRLR